MHDTFNHQPYSASPAMSSRENDCHDENGGIETLFFLSTKDMPFKNFWRDIIQVDRQLDSFLWGWVVVSNFLIPATCFPFLILLLSYFLFSSFCPPFFLSHFMIFSIRAKISFPDLAQVLPAIESAKKFLPQARFSSPSIF